MASESYERAEQGARANAHSRHAACYRNEKWIEEVECCFECSTRRAGRGRGSSLTLAKEATARLRHNLPMNRSEIVVKYVARGRPRRWEANCPFCEYVKDVGFTSERDKDAYEAIARSGIVSHAKELHGEVID